jgi:hypothetical protein
MGDVFTGGGGRGPQWAVAICSGRGYLFQHKKRYQKANLVLLKGTNSHGQAQIATARTNSHGQGTYSHGPQGTPGAQFDLTSLLTGNKLQYYILCLMLPITFFAFFLLVKNGICF